MTIRDPAFLQLAAHFRERRSALLRNWRSAVGADKSLTSGESLPRVQLDDHVPSALIAFEDHLAQISELDAKEATEATIESANAHGLHRWQQGYNLNEVVRELGHLNRVIVAELDAFADSSHVSSGCMAAARQAWASAYAVSVEQSTTQFFKLQQTESLGHVADLEAAMATLSDVEKQRAALWEQLAHDLRGNVGVVAAASRALGYQDSPEKARKRFSVTLERNVESLRHLLDDVTSLTRLHAGVEKLNLGSFDVNILLGAMCEGMQALADQRGLYLRAVAKTEPLMVEGDAVKIRRLAQNLIINALKYTTEGGVVVTWAACDAGDRKRWSLVVQDTGPGMQGGRILPLAEALKDATDLAHDNAPAGEPIKASAASTNLLAQPAGEGIGLSIVKRLADILNATVELESEAKIGTKFTVYMPTSYIRRPVKENQAIQQPPT